MDKELVDLLICPQCKSKLRYQENEERIYCLNKECRLVYPVKKGIPVMLVSEAMEAPV